MPSRRRRARATSDLRLAIECLPERTREAMLEGIATNHIIVGAYVDGEGGVCPMLAAHRCGGRTDLLAFARAWDRFTGADGAPRPATRREIGILIAHLQSSLLGPTGADLAQAITEHRRLQGRPEPKPAEAPRPGDRYRAGELRLRPGWAWLRPFRRLDEYERALEKLDQGHEQSDAQVKHAHARSRARQPA